MSSFSSKSVAWAALSLWVLTVSIGPLPEARGQVPEEQPQGAVVLKGLSKKLSVDFRQIDVLEAVRFLAEQGNLNIVPGKNVGGRVTLSLKDITIRDVMDVIMLTNELAYTQKGNIIHVMTEADYQRLFGDPFNDQRQVRQLQLSYAATADVAAILGNIKSPVGKVIADPTTGTVILVDTQEKLDQLVETAKNLDLAAQPQSTRIFELKYADAETIKGEVEQLLTPNIGTLRFDKRTNTLAVQDLPLRMREIEKVIGAFDRRTRQVLIEAKVISVRLSDSLKTGVNWEAVFQGVQGLNVVSTLPVVPPLAVSGKLTIGTLARDNFTAVMELLQEIGTTDLLSTPQISVIENETAKILVGTREAFVTSVVTQTQQASTTAEQLTFIEVGIKLSVTPSINQDGFVTMKIVPEVSEVTDQLTTALGNVVPIVKTSIAETTVMARDGTTIVIAGLIRDSMIKTEKRVPILGSIPILGAIFRSRSEKVVREEIVFFLTPSVITGAESVAGVSAPPREAKAKPPVRDVLKRLDSVLERMRGIVEESSEARPEATE